MNKNSLKVVRYRMRIKRKLIQYKGGKCQMCGYSKPIPGAYHFHHRNPEEKLFGISGSTLGIEALKREADKCDLVCACCHAEIHNEAWKDIDIELARKPRTKRKCEKCEQDFVPKRKEQKYCSRTCSPKFIAVG